MFKQVMDVIGVSSGVFAMVTWLWVFMYFILVGISPMLGRIAITATILTVVSIYCMKME